MKLGRKAGEAANYNLLSDGHVLKGGKDCAITVGLNDDVDRGHFHRVADHENTAGVLIVRDGIEARVGETQLLKLRLAGTSVTYIAVLVTVIGRAHKGWT